MTHPFWNKKNNSYDKIQTDVAVIGGGYAGLSTAYWLSELKPDLKIHIIERSNLGSGASGRNAGFLTLGSAYFYKNLHQKWGKEKALKIYNFSRSSLDLFSKHILGRNQNLECNACISSTLIRSMQQKDEIQADGFNPEDFNFFWKDSSTLPEIIQKKFFGSYDSLSEYKINPANLISSLRFILSERNVKFLENTFVYELTEEGLATESSFINAKQVILATNAYSAEIHPGFKTIITPRRAQMLAVKIHGDFFAPGIYYDPADRVYWRMYENNTLLIGGKRLLDEAGEIGSFEKISPIIQKGLETYLVEQLGIDFEIKSRWSGIMGFTEHELPVISKIKGPIDSFMLGGFSGHGMGMGFRAGLEMAEIVLGIKRESFFSHFKKFEINL
jgi:gamma-glutamylputrescine oxidase